MILKNEKLERELYVSDELDMDGEIKLEATNTFSEFNVRYYLTIDQACQLRDHLDKVIGEVK